MQTGSGVPAQQPAPPVDPAVRAIEAQVQSNPNDLDLRDQLAKAYLDSENFRGVVEQTQFVLQRKANDPRALTYEALVRMTMGQNEQAGAMLDAATKADPNLIDAWVGLAWLRTLTGKDAEAQAAIDEAAKRRPEDKPRLDELLAQMRQHQTTTAGAVQQQQQGQQATAAPMGNPAGAGDASASAGDPKQSVQITLDIDPAAKGRIPPNGVIFLLARPEGVSSGPPLAVKRVMPGAFPMSVAIGAADSMMGQPLPAKVRIEARYDADGNAMTRSPEDLNAVADGVAVGTAAITMKLR